MHRRALLAALGVGTLAGCSGRTGETTASANTTSPTGTQNGTADDRPTGTGSPDETPTGEFDPTSVVDLETTPRTYALTPTRYRSDDGAAIRVGFTDTATADSPVVVTARLRNANGFANTFRLDWTPPFGRLVSDAPRPAGARTGDATYRESLVFAPTAGHDLVDDSPELTRDADGLWRLATDETPSLPETVRLAAGETIHGEYALVGQADGAGGGRPPGVYEFSRAGERPVRVAVWETDAPGPTDTSRFASVSVPPVGDGTAWFHEADRTTPTYVAPSTERTSLPARITFVFHNRSRERLGCGHWNLYKHHDGRWFHLGPYVHTADCRLVWPGGTVRHTIRAANGPMAPCRARSYPFLGGGRYAVVAGYGHATGASGALFDVDAPLVRVVPTDDARVERANGVATVTGEPWRTADEADRVRLRLKTVADADRPLVAEQVMRSRFRAFRNTLAVAADADRVRLRTTDGVADRALGYDTRAARVRFRGTAYRLERESDE